MDYINLTIRVRTFNGAPVYNFRILNNRCFYSLHPKGKTFWCYIQNMGHHLRISYLQPDVMFDELSNDIKSDVDSNTNFLKNQFYSNKKS